MLTDSARPLAAAAPLTRCQRHSTASFSGRVAASPVRLSLKPVGRRPASYGRQHRQISAALGQANESYQGVYGPWTVEEADRKEVLGYRAGLSIAATALLADTVISWLPVADDSGLKQVLRPLSDFIAVAGASGFGVSLVLIHIYVKPIKQLLQALFALGFASGLYLAVTQAQSLPEYVGTHREAVWAVGPLFASVTGVAFKEGMCYGKAECAALFFAVPTLLLGHLTGLLPDTAENVLLAAVVAIAGVFAARKYTQPIKDDIGDKSIFEFLALSQEEQEAKVQELQSRQG